MSCTTDILLLAKYCSLEIVALWQNSFKFFFLIIRGPVADKYIYIYIVGYHRYKCLSSLKRPYSYFVFTKYPNRNNLIRVTSTKCIAYWNISITSWHFKPSRRRNWNIYFTSWKTVVPYFGLLTSMIVYLRRRVVSNDIIYRIYVDEMIVFTS